MDSLFCQRLGKAISHAACGALVCALATADDLRPCLRCPHGRALAASSPFGDRRREARHAARHSEECLRATLRYVAPRYADRGSFGIRFLNVVAGNRCGWDGTPDALASAAGAVGLTVRDRPWSVVRDAALREFIA